MKMRKMYMYIESNNSNIYFMKNDVNNGMRENVKKMAKKKRRAHETQATEITFTFKNKLSKHLIVPKNV